MKKLFSVLGCLLVLLFVLVGVSAQETKSIAAKKKVLVATEASFPPMEFVDDAGQVVGFDIDLVKAVAARGKFEVEFQNVAWDGIFAALKNGNYDMVASSVTITPDRKAQFDFSEPYLKAGQVILVRTEDRSKYPDMASLKGKKVGVQIATTGSERMEKEPVELKQYNTAGLVFQDLINGNIDAVMMDKPVADYYASKKPESAKKIVVVGEPHTSEQFGLVLRKGDTQLKAMVDGGLAEIRKDGTLERLEKKWFR